MQFSSLNRQLSLAVHFILHPLPHNSPTQNPSKNIKLIKCPHYLYRIVSFLLCVCFCFCFFLCGGFKKQHTAIVRRTVHHVCKHFGNNVTFTRKSCTLVQASVANAQIIPWILNSVGVCMRKKEKVVFLLLVLFPSIILLNFLQVFYANYVSIWFFAFACNWLRQTMPFAN